MSEFTPQRNKAFVLEAFETLFNKKDFVAAEKFWSSNLHSRVRRKRKRLPSNGSIESDAAVGHRIFHRDCLTASLPIEC